MDKIASPVIFRILSSLIILFSLFKIANSTFLDSTYEAILINSTCIFFALFCGGFKRNLFDPWNQILAVWFLFGILHPLARLISTESYKQGQLGLEVSETLPKASIIFSIGALLTLAGISVGRRSKSLRPHSEMKDDRYLPVSFEIFFVLIWITGSLLLLREIGLTGLTQWRSRQTQAALLSVSSYLFFTNYLLIAPGLLRLLKDNRTKWDSKIGFSLLYGPVVLNVLSGNRIFVIPIIILHFYVYLNKKRRLGLITILVPILLIFLTTSSLRYFRESTDPYSKFTSYSLVEQQISIFEGQDFAMLDNFSLLVRADARNSGIPFGDYLNILTKPIPRQFWPSKPQTFDQEINRLLLPSKSQTGYGFSFTFIGESFYEFGLFGLFLICISYGFFLGRCIVWSLGSSGLKRQLVGLIAISLIVVFARGSFSADSPRFLFALVPLVFMRRKGDVEK